MLKRDSPLFTRPMNSSISFGLFPAAVIRVGVEISFGIKTDIPLFFFKSQLFLVDSNTVYCNTATMNETFSIEELAQIVNDWCEEHGVSPASGQAGERISVRNIRYYRALALLDPPLLGGGQGFGEKHRLQLVAIRLLQAQGLPLQRIQELLFGRSLEDLRRIEEQGLAELEQASFKPFQPSATESWRVTPLNEEFMLVSRRGRSIAPELRERLLTIIEPNNKPPRHSRNIPRSK